MSIWRMYFRSQKKWTVHSFNKPTATTSAPTDPQFSWTKWQLKGNKAPFSTINPRPAAGGKDVGPFSQQDFVTCHCRKSGETAKHWWHTLCSSNKWATVSEYELHGISFWMWLTTPVLFMLWRAKMSSLKNTYYGPIRPEAKTPVMVKSMLLWISFCKFVVEVCIS